MSLSVGRQEQAHVRIAGGGRRGAAPRGNDSSSPAPPRGGWLLSAILFGVIPSTLLVAHFSDLIITGSVGWDFQTYYDAARQLTRSGTPYGDFDEHLFSLGREYVYPPLTAIGVVPFTLLPPQVAGLIATTIALGALIAIPLVVGVRDWRCVGVFLLWPPVITGLQTTNLTVLVGLAAAVAWRFRDRAPLAGAGVGIAVAAKLTLWPLVAWQCATRRWAAVAWTSALAVGLLAASWAVVAFDGLLDYPGILRRLKGTFGDHAYSVYAVALEAGAPEALAACASLALAAVLLWAAVGAGRRGLDRRSFSLALVASLAVTPTVWLEHFSWLVVVVALARPKLAPVWFVPLAMWLTAGSHSPSEAQRLTTLAVAALTVYLALRREPALASGGKRA